MPPPQGVEVFAGLAQLLDHAGQFLAAVVGEDVEHLLQVLQNLLLIGRGQPQSIIADLVARCRHVGSDRQPPGLGQGVIERLRG